MVSSDNYFGHRLPGLRAGPSSPTCPLAYLPSSLSSLCPQQMCLPSPECMLTGRVLGKTPGPSSVSRAWRSSLKCIAVSTPGAMLLPVSSPLPHAWIFLVSVSTPSFPPLSHSPAAGTGVFLKTQMTRSPSKSEPKSFQVSSHECQLHALQAGHVPLSASMAVVTPPQPWDSHRGHPRVAGQPVPGAHLYHEVYMQPQRTWPMTRCPAAQCQWLPLATPPGPAFTLTIRCHVPFTKPLL